jgi:hypothetical protein
MNDPALMVDARKRQRDLDPLGGEELEGIAKESMATS